MVKSIPLTKERAAKVDEIYQHPTDNGFCYSVHLKGVDEVFWCDTVLEVYRVIDRNGNIMIDIPDTCKRDLWDAQMEYWLEKCVPEHGNKIIDNGIFRIVRNKLRFIRNKK